MSNDSRCKPALLLRSLEVGGRRASADTPVWLLGPHGRDTSLVELRSVQKRGALWIVPNDALLACPVPRPALEALCERDACFGWQSPAFDVLEVNQEHQFRLLRCAHGRMFLEDLRGGAAQYLRLILVEPLEDEASVATWQRYHAMSDDWLNHLGIAK
jgi:hypothetical protein